jgi:hypothetical protein
MEVCYWALLFMLLVILHHLLNVFVQLANKREFKQTNKNYFVVITEQSGPEAGLVTGDPDARTFDLGAQIFLSCFAKMLLRLY